MEVLRLDQEVNIHEHYDGIYPCIGRLGIVRQLASGEQDQIIECLTCHSQTVIYQADRSRDHYPKS